MHQSDIESESDHDSEFESEVERQAAIDRLPMNLNEAEQRSRGEFFAKLEIVLTFGLLAIALAVARSCMG